jgi:lysyl-tRNA synthetase class I
MSETRVIAGNLVHSLGYDKDGFTACDPAMLIDAIDTALKQAVADEREAKWRPIESAPRDVGRVLVACQTDNGWEFEVSYQDKKGDWIYQTCEPFFCLGWYMEPKFWQPLPPPPAIRHNSQPQGEQ